MLTFYPSTRKKTVVSVYMKLLREVTFHILPSLHRTKHGNCKIMFKR